MIIGQAPAVRPTVGASTIVGRRGRFTWHDYPAGDVHVFTVTRSALLDGVRVWSLRGQVSHVNPFTIAQRPLTLVVPYARGAWYWPVVTLVLDDDRCRAVLGAPIKPDTIAQAAHIQSLVERQAISRSAYVARTALERLALQQQLVR